ncbi:MAG: helix-hairpin-helix domain-containing protein [candidate division Zixibacteria bacterium]|nr:helix-hairpin-helix domain-containing protein [candidate division Zixibacteria bacterium]
MNKPQKNNSSRALSDLVSVGPATIKDLHLLGITKVSQLKKRNAEKLYHKLCEISDAKHDICALDVLRAAIEQANDPNLPVEKCQWHY